MNQRADDQSTEDVSGDSFASQDGSQTNPFTADLKGEFTSNFGTNTNAVSQIFRDGSFSEGRSKTYMIVGAIVLALLAGYFFLFMGDSEEDFPSQLAQVEDGADQQGDDIDAGEDEGASIDDADIADEAIGEAPDESAGLETGISEAAPEETAVAEPEPEMAPATDVPVLATPADGASRAYDETSASANFSWNGSPGGYIVFSRSPSMRPEVLRARVSGNSYRFTHPWPGNWYWRVDNGAGSSEVRSFAISGIVRRNVQVAEPQPGGAVSGSGGVVTWTGDVNVAHYRIEVSNGGWANPTYRFATSGTQAQLQGVQPGEYQLRVGAFSEVAGRWEYTNPIPVSVQ